MQAQDEDGRRGAKQLKQTQLHLKAKEPGLTWPLPDAWA